MSGNEEFHLKINKIPNYYLKHWRKKCNIFQYMQNFPVKILRNKKLNIHRNSILLARLNIHKHALLLSERFSLLYLLYTDSKHKCINIQNLKIFQLFFILQLERNIILITKHYYRSTRSHEVIRNFRIVFVIITHPT